MRPQAPYLLPEPAGQIPGDHGSVGSVQRALLNILEDLTEEQENFEGAQRAVLNILEDFDAEKKKVELMNHDLQAEIEGRLQAQEEIKKLNRSLEQRVMERTAELATSNKELEAFSYSVSHDLRAPLRAIDGFCRILLEDFAGTLPMDGQVLLQRVRAASQRMDKLIEGLLWLSRMSRSEISRRRVDITLIAHAVVLELQKANPASRVDVVIAPGLVADGDPSFVRIVLENLLGNAWKFTSKHPHARVEVGAVEHQGETAFFVRDDGAGFDMAYADKLFGAFQRLHTPAEFEGTGIGLANVQRIIHRHGGRVWAEGEVEKGATFFFTLPTNPR